MAYGAGGLVAKGMRIAFWDMMLNRMLDPDSHLRRNGRDGTDIGDIIDSLIMFKGEMGRKRVKGRLRTG